MARFIIERDMGGPITEEALQAAGRRSNEVLAGMTDVVWVKSYISQAEGKIYCEYDAPNEAAVREHARRAGLPADRITAVSMEVSPEMFH